MFDQIIRNGTVLDGSGSPRRRADVGIRGMKIIAVDDLSGAKAAEEIDAAGKMVAPGFIDIHSHADFILPFLPTADSKVHQGITLEVTGNCGDSFAPLSVDMRVEANEENRQHPERKVDWLSFAEYTARLQDQGISVNTAILVGHGTLRRKVMQMSNAAPTAEQMSAMQHELRTALEQGAIGLSTGLIYTPSVYAKTDEIIALARTVANMGGIYTSHIRGEANTLLEALDEALLVGREAGIRVEVSHLKASGIKNWHKMEPALEKLERARENGIDVAADMYPYNASNTGLSSLIPDWVHVDGLETMLARLKDPAVRAQLHHDLADVIDVNGVDWDQIYISDCPDHPTYEGRHLAEIAAERRQHPWDAVMDILIECRLRVDIIEFTMRADNVARGLQDPWVSVCTDAGGRAAEGPFSEGRPHPRNYGSFPRVLGYYCREQCLFSWEEAVRKMTGLPASRLRLSDRGLLKPGFCADLVVFDPLHVADQATFTDPHRYPTGIDWVMVNGEVVIANGQHTGARPGRVIS